VREVQDRGRKKSERERVISVKGEKEKERRRVISRIFRGG
jgi:hypothetical protein